MEISVSSIYPTIPNTDATKVVPAAKPDRNKDRRKKKQDRRKNVREGIFVFLSTKEDQRNARDRRRTEG